MDGVNLQASINSVPQMDRFQQDVNRQPLVSQEQNAAISREQQAQRALRPEEPEETENKIVDPRDNKKNLAEKKKKRQQQLKKKDERILNNHQVPSVRSGSTIDFTA
jgi:hypothetical protein